MNQMTKLKNSKIGRMVMLPGIVAAILLALPDISFASPQESRPGSIIAGSDCGFRTSPECMRRFVQQLREMTAGTSGQSGSPAQPIGKRRDETRRHRSLTLVNGRAVPWTVLFYDCADQGVSDVFNYFVEEFNSGPNVEVLVLRDTPETTTQLFHVNEDHSTTLLEDWGELNMSESATLRDFLLYAGTVYPADHYFLALYGHGGAWMGAGGDNASGFSMLSMEAMQQALQESMPVDILAFTAPCLMGNLEAVYQLRDLVDVYIASAESSNYLMWQGMVDDIRNMLNDTPETSVYTMADMIVQWVYDNNLGSGNYEEYFTLSAIRCDLLPAAGTAMTDLIAALRARLPTGFPMMRDARNATEMYGIVDEDYWQLCDVLDFIEEYALLETDPGILGLLEQARQAIDAAIIAEWHGSEQDGGHGLTIFYPTNNTEYQASYDTSQLDFLTTTAWDQFLHEYAAYNPPTPTPTPTPQVTVSPIPTLPIDRSPQWFGPAIDSTFDSIDDFNADGMPDLLVIQDGEPHRIFFNTSSGWEAAPGWQFEWDTGIHALSAVTGDVTNDGYPDIVFIYESYDPETLESTPVPVELVANRTGMPETVAMWSSLPNVSYRGAFDDINGDGYEDLFLGGCPDRHSVYLGTADGNLETTPAWLAANSEYCREVKLADLDNDGDPDLVLLSYYHSLFIYRNIGGTFETEYSWAAPLDLALYASDIDIADYDRDGYPEIAICREMNETTILLENDHGEISSEPAWESRAEDFSQSIAWGDINGDGYPELCTANFARYWDGVQWIQNAAADFIYYNDGGSLIQQPAWVSDTLDTSERIAFIDMDGDFDLDLFMACRDCPVSVFRNTSGCAVTGISLVLTARMFYPGDPFGLRADMCSAESAPIDSRVFVLMELAGTFYCAPSWCDLSTAVDNYAMEIPPGRSELEIIPVFPWPKTGMAMFGICLYGAVTDPAMTGLIGEMDQVFFSFM